MKRYLRENSLKRTYAEDWRIARRSWKVLFLWVPKLMGKRREFGSPMPWPVPFGDHQVPFESVSAMAMEALRKPLEDARALGFDPPLYQILEPLRRESVVTAAACRHSAGEVAVRIMHVHVAMVHPAVDRVSMMLYSRLRDGRWIITTSEAKVHEDMPGAVVERVVGRPLADLVARHRQVLDSFRTQSAPRRLAGDDELKALVDELELGALEHGLRRGLYEEVPPEEVGKILASSAPVAAEGAETDPVEADALAELERLQNRKGSWSAALLIATLSFVAFLAWGHFQWGGAVALTLAGVVLVHEFGHYVAMRVFKYRNLRMFFVPLAGAAVTGQKFNVQGWKQVLVSLAGPLPGIVLGFGLAAVGALLGVPLLGRIALMALVVNALNLIPVLPLDGGWTLNAILFSRHFAVETVFRILAVLALVGVWMAGEGSLFLVLGILVLLGVPINHRMGRIARELRQRGLGGVPDDAEVLPRETALTIIRELKAKLPGPQNGKTLGGLTLPVFEKLNASPPGIVASLLLSLLYLGGWVVALMGLVLASVAMSGGL